MPSEILIRFLLWQNGIIDFPNNSCIENGKCGIFGVFQFRWSLIFINGNNAVYFESITQCRHHYIAMKEETGRRMSAETKQPPSHLLCLFVVYQLIQSEPPSKTNLTFYSQQHLTWSFNIFLFTPKMCYRFMLNLWVSYDFKFSISSTHTVCIEWFGSYSQWMNDWKINAINLS